MTDPSEFDPDRTSTHGGGRHYTAVIGAPPELRDWKPGDPMHEPNISDTARIEAFATIDAGSRIATTIGPRTWLMKHVHVGHDSLISADCELAPGVVIGGNVRIGAGVKVGVNACVKPGVDIGDGARIGCGAVVTKDVPAGETWVGNPAHRIGG